MANKDYDSRYDRGIARERVHASNSWNTYDGDSARDRASQRRAWSGADMGSRHQRLGGPGRFGQSRSTQDFENANALRYNRGREGDQEWRVNDYDAEDYTADQRASDYGERYGLSGYGRAQYDPDINRNWQEPEETERTQGQRSQSRAASTENRYGQHRSGGDDREEEQVPYASHKNGQRAHGRNQRHEYMGGERGFVGRDAQDNARQYNTRRARSTSPLLVPLLVLGGFAVLAGAMQMVMPRVVESIGRMFSRD